MKVMRVAFAVQVPDEWTAACDWLDTQLALTAIKELLTMDVKVQRDPWPEPIEEQT